MKLSYTHPDFDILQVEELTALCQSTKRVTIQDLQETDYGEF